MIGLATMPHHRCESPHHLLLARMHSLAKIPPSSLLTMARDSGSDKLVNSNLIYRIKVDNGHGLVAHSARVPPYSTQLLISKLAIIIVPLIDLSSIVESTHTTINQTDCVFGHVLSPPWYCEASFPSYAELLTSSSSALQLIHACLPLLLEASTHFPRI